MTNIMRWLQNSFYGGVSGDQFIGVQNSSQSIKNLTFRDEAKVMKLAKKPVANAVGVIADWVQCFLTVQGTGTVIAFGDTGKIYRRTSGTGDFTLVYTDSTNRKIISAYEYNSFIYWATADKLHRIAVGDVSSTWPGKVIENYKTFTNQNSSFHPMLEVYNKLYIGDGKYLSELDNSAIFTDSKISIFGDEQIVALTFNGSRVKIYSQRTSNIDYGRSYLWDGVSSAYNEFLSWPGSIIHGATSMLNMDYVIAGRQPSIYISNGYTSQLAKRMPGFGDGESCVISNNAILTSGNLIYIGMTKSGTNSANPGTWTYGAKEKDFPVALNNEYSVSTNSAVVAAVHVSSGNVYQSWKQGSNYGVDITGTIYADSGEMISRAWDGGLGSAKKKPKTIKMAFKNLAAGEKIDLYMRRDLSSSWGSPVITADYANTDDRAVTFKELSNTISESIGGTYNYVEVKAVLTAGTSNLTTPTLTEIILDSEFIQIQ